MRYVYSILCLLSLFLLSHTDAFAESSDRWDVGEDCRSIVWTVDNYDGHRDHIEMSGMQVSTVLRYGVDTDGKFYLNRSMVWPMLRTVPNNTHASLLRRFAFDPLDGIELNGCSVEDEKVQEVAIDGTLRVRSLLSLPKGSLELSRTLFPSTTLPALCELYVLRNVGEGTVMCLGFVCDFISINSLIRYENFGDCSCYGSFALVGRLFGQKPD